MVAPCDFCTAAVLARRDVRLEPGGFHQACPTCKYTCMLPQFSSGCRRNNAYKSQKDQGFLSTGRRSCTGHNALHPERRSSSIWVAVPALSALHNDQTRERLPTIDLLASLDAILWLDNAAALPLLQPSQLWGRHSGMSRLQLTLGNNLNNW